MAQQWIRWTSDTAKNYETFIHIWVVQFKWHFFNKVESCGLICLTLRLAQKGLKGKNSSYLKSPSHLILLYFGWASEKTQEVPGICIHPHYCTVKNTCTLHCLLSTACSKMRILVCQPTSMKQSKWIWRRKQNRLPLESRTPSGVDCGLWAPCPVSMETTYRPENQAPRKKSSKAPT